MRNKGYKFLKKDTLNVNKVEIRDKISYTAYVSI